MSKEKKLCEPCGDKEYPNVNKGRQWAAMTVSMGKCPKCGKEDVLIPIADFEGHGD